MYLTVMFCVIDDNEGYCDNLCGDNRESKISLSPILLICVPQQNIKKKASVLLIQACPMMLMRHLCSLVVGTCTW